MTVTARRLSVVSATSTPRRRLIRVVRPTSRAQHVIQMSDSWDISITDPAGVAFASLRYAGEVRFGPAYYYLSLVGYESGERLFGCSYLYDDSQSILALQEWMDRRFDSPNTSLLLLDIRQRRECRVAGCSDGFISATSIDSEILTFRRVRYGLHASTSEAEIAYRELDRWQPFTTIKARATLP